MDQGGGRTPAAMLISANSRNATVATAHGAHDVDLLLNLCEGIRQTGG